MYNHIIGNGRHRYEFNEIGVDCRKWVAGQLDLLDQAGLVIDQGQVLSRQRQARNPENMARSSLQSTWLRKILWGKWMKWVPAPCSKLIK